MELSASRPNNWRISKCAPSHSKPASCGMACNAWESPLPRGYSRALSFKGWPNTRTCSFATYRGAAFDLAQIEKTMRSLYLHSLSRRKATEGRLAGRGIAKATQSAPGLSETTCHNCQYIGRYTYDCPSPLNSSGNSENDGGNRRMLLR